MSGAKVKRSIKGRRPQFFADREIDRLHGMVMAMATEMSVLYQRIDTMERVAAKKGVVLREELDDRLGQENEAQYQRFLDDIAK